MKALLLCPSEPAMVKLLSVTNPLVALPLLGQSLLEYWLTHLALSGVKDVRILAHDRPDHIRVAVNDGSRWGLNVEVLSELRELTPSQTLLKYAPELESKSNPASLVVLDRFPSPSNRSLFESYADFFSGLREWMPHAVTPDRVGIRQVESGVWVSTHARLSPGAKLIPPCWVGERAFIGAGAILGPGAIIDTGAFVEPGVEVCESWVGPDTFVGQFARVARSLALGNQLIHWPTGAATTIFDSFLICAVRRPRRLRGPGWMARAAELYSRNKEDVLCLWKQLLLHKES